MTTSTRATASHGARNDRSREVAAGRDGVLADPVIRRHRLGQELRRLREDRSLRLEDAASELGVAPSTLSRIETGLAPARTCYVQILLDLYGQTDETERRRLTDLAREGQRKGWWADVDHLLPSGAGSYLGLESAASAIRAFTVQTIPGLLQTRDYATAACHAARPGVPADTIRSLAAVTPHRQASLRDGHHLHAIIDESALLRLVGTTSIMAAQLAHLRDLAACPSLTVQILALSGPRGMLSAAFTVLSFPDPADPEVACRVGSEGQLALIRRGPAVSALRRGFDALSMAAMPVEESGSLISEMAPAR